MQKKKAEKEVGGKGSAELVNKIGEYEKVIKEKEEMITAREKTITERDQTIKENYNLFNTLSKNDASSECYL